ncbi:serine hydrolase domain-containing protein [Pyxidicoccus xibeiensis]|uniref:serine hydrolase domain-containing protein n=1 Tax=Pyxidicoccus xibeiensis TaxID=2906759 RepID=UPI0020A7141B|nr:serine hydrolase domain-containing protein [Pyxidicoccus xibeiensis]MCP3140236.1 beta-lactamase family protein [Pyxidicoccus xibeiensis]
MSRAPPAPEPPADDLLLAETRRYVRGYRSASLCAGLTLRGVHHLKALRGKGAPPAPDAIFALGELTQVFTGALLALMVDRGELRLDTPLSELLPRPLLPDATAGRITLEQLATHTSGLPHLPPNLEEGARNPEDPFGHYSAGMFGDFLRGYQPALPPPRPYAGSLLGMGVLGHALSRRAGLNYGHALRDGLCKPLGLGDTTLRLSEEQQPRLVSGHTARGKPVPAWNFPALPGAGALHSTAGDLLRFLDAHLGRADAALVRALRLTQVPRVDAGPARQALGWTVSQVRGHAVLWRSSVMGGYTGFLGLAPAADAGVVLLADHGWSLLAALRGRVPLEAPGFSLLTRLLPLP